MYVSWVLALYCIGRNDGFVLPLLFKFAMLQEVS